MICLWSLIAIGIIIGSLIYASKKGVLISQVIIVANFIIFFLCLFESSIIQELAFEPVYLYKWQKSYTLITSIFLHGGIVHILMNMIVFALIGIPLERRIGKGKFAVIYFLTGITGALFFSILHLGSETMLIGASGAIFGILGAFATAYPRDEVVMPVFIIFMRMPVILAALMFGGIETIYASSGLVDGVAHLAHLGGLVSGIFLSAIMIKKKVAIPHKKIDFDVLQSLSQEKEMLDRARNADVPEIRDAWLDHFIKTARCPKCGERLSHDGRTIWCKCGFKLEYKK